MLDVRRREFITLLGGAAALPLAARGQQPSPMVGFVHRESAKAFGHVAAAFRRGLADTDFFEGRSIAIEYRWAEGQLDRLPALVADLLRRQPAVIVTNAAQEVRFGLVINLKTARALGLTVPDKLLSTADEVIE